MNKYVVAYSSDSDSDDIEQGLVEAISTRDAVLKYLAQFQDTTFDEAKLLAMEDVDAVMDYCYDYMAVSLSIVQV
jgi:hypothetical protein